MKRAHLPPPILTTFYRSTVESILTNCISVWCGGCTAADWRTVRRVVRTAEKIIGSSLPSSVQDIAPQRCVSRARIIIKDASHPHHGLVSPVEHITVVFRALPLLFPSSTMPPKKLGSTSEALFHVLATSEDPDGFLLQRPLSSPVLLVSEDNCMIAIGNTPVTTFTMDRRNEGLLYLMAYYYALHMTYPKCISTLLSVLQTEVDPDLDAFPPPYAPGQPELQIPDAPQADPPPTQPRSRPPTSPKPKTRRPKASVELPEPPPRASRRCWLRSPDTPDAEGTD
ncbi:hypothetical protein L3Q82_019108 [Scortum barcoo]|uniref:Uncharacterized protein n=1 Tax=Scortum barcoo TaxID=214431 RepID=A0ACB8VGB6_9TELE|nr:hypothetical protein L3Q82_019108 [Scortum barcoo]